MEEWRKIPGYPEFYEVSNCGNVRTWHRHGTSKLPLDEPRLKSTHPDQNGYRVVKLFVNKKRGYHKVGKLVLLAFDGPCPEGCEMSHLYGKDDERVEALVWETPEQNREREEMWPRPGNYVNRHPLKKMKVVRPSGEAERERRKRLKEAGLCLRCRKTRNLYANYCDVCQGKFNEYQRKKSGGSAWKPGSRGRVPKSFTGSHVTPAQAEALKLKGRGLSYAQIAVRLGISEAAVTDRVYKGRKNQRRV
jgi:hypothetical protein